MTWNTKQAIDLVRRIEAVAPLAGCHVALTGGCLYKDGDRKDLDILFYRIRQVDKINTDMLKQLLTGVGVTDVKGWGWLYKGKFGDKDIDMFFPEEVDGGVYGAASPCTETPSFLAPL